MSGQEAPDFIISKRVCKIAVSDKEFPPGNSKRSDSFRNGNLSLGWIQIKYINEIAHHLHLLMRSIDSSRAFSLSQDSLSLILYTKIITLLFHTGIKMLLTLHTPRFQWAEGLSIRADSLVATMFNRYLTVTTFCVVRMFVFKRITAVNCKYKSEFNS